jgi:predicted nicotinamide N-methyase
MKEKVKAVAFVRMQSRMETIARSNIKLEAKKQIIAKAASSLDIEIVEWFSMFGGLYAFTSLQKVLDYCKNNTDVKYVLVSNVNTTSRNASNIYHWQSKFSEAGVQILTFNPKTKTLEDLV